MTRSARRIVALAVAGWLAATAHALAQTPTLGWSPIGPHGGSMSALAIDPGDASHLVGGATSGGIWTSHDSGSTWTPVSDGVPSLAITAIVVNPATPQILFAGTGPSYAANFTSTRPGSGILKSADGGATWTRLTSTATPAFAEGVQRLAISADGTIVLAAVHATVYRSTDGGSSWTPTFVPPPDTGLISDVAFLGGSSSNALMTFGSGLYQSGDGGSTWSPANLSLIRDPSRGAFPVRIAVSPSAPSLVYVTATVVSIDPVGHVSSNLTDVYRSTDGGTTYQRVGTTGVASAIWVAPASAPGLVVVGGTHLFRSTDSGVTWTQISDAALAPDSLAAGVGAITGDPAFNGGANRRVYFATDGGVYKTDDITTATAAAHGGYANLSDGLQATRITSAAGSGDGTILAGRLDGAYKGVPSGGVWSWARTLAGFVADAGSTIVDPADSRYQYVFVVPPGTAAGFNDRGYRTTDGGASWVDLTQDTRFDFRLSFALHPDDPNTMFLASLRRTRDVKTGAAGGPMWTNLLEDCYFYNVIGLAAGPVHRAIVSCLDGMVRRTDNALDPSPAWSPVTGLPSGRSPVTGLAFGGPITRIVFGDTAATVYVTYGRETGPNVWRSTDGGTTWTPASGSGAALPDVPVRSFTIDPRNPLRLFAGTDAGVYSSADGGASWKADGPATLPVTDLFWVGHDLIAATDGRGLFRAPVTAMTMVIDDPKPDRVLTPAIIVRGWAIDRAAESGSGIDAVHVYGFPNGNTLAPPTFLGTATLVDRDDVAAVYGDRYRHSGFELTLPSLAQLDWLLVAYAHSTVTGTFDISRTVFFGVGPPESRPAMNIDTPSGTVGGRFTVRGWALDRGQSPAAGVDAVHVYAMPGAGGPATFVGAAAYGQARWDVANVFGARFLRSGYALEVDHSLSPGDYTLIVYARSVVSGQWFSQTRAFTVRAPGNPLMTIDTPSNGASVNQPFLLAGWTVDLDAASGPGVDAVHVWAYPLNGGSPMFVGVGQLNFARGDVGAIFGAQFIDSGYNVTVSGLPPGQYQIVVYAHSTVTGTFNQSRVVTVTIGS